jgi:hypothetical protein
MVSIDFIAFDTETATAQLSSLCQLGFVVVTNTEIVKLPKEFEEKIRNYTKNLDRFFEESRLLEEQIKKNMGGLRFEKR